MPPIFKALASIVVWILFVFGCVALLGGLVRAIGAGLELLPAYPRPIIGAYFSGGIVSLILSVVAMKLRQSME
jgi:hypothetical protein